MFDIRTSPLLVVAAFGLAGCAAPPAAAPDAPAPPSERVGVTLANPHYGFGDEPVMIEGARRILDLGSRVIKLWFTDQAPVFYAFNDAWPKVDSLVDLARTPTFKAVFAMPFKTYILTVYPLGRKNIHSWRGGMSEEQKRQEIDAFESLTVHLLTTYQGTGKTFVLQHWEGDWSIGRPTAPGNDAWEPDPNAVQGMIDWLNARQEGVDRGRAKAKVSGCNVYHAAEVNKVQPALDGHKGCIADLVVPKTHCDLYSYSAYDTCIPRTNFRRAVEYLAARAPDSAAFGANNVYIGEFGIPENGFPPGQFQAVIRHTTETALDLGCPYVVYWQLYDNECKVRPAKANADCRGFWLVRPDGTKSWAWDYFEKLIKTGR